MGTMMSPTVSRCVKVDVGWKGKSYPIDSKEETPMLTGTERPMEHNLNRRKNHVVPPARNCTALGAWRSAAHLSNVDISVPRCSDRIAIFSSSGLLISTRRTEVVM